MCVYRQLIRNPHDGRHYWVKCGQCDACLQEKANKHRSRINRELNNSVNGSITNCFFVTLHYDNNHLPFVRHSELIRFFEDCVAYKRCKNVTKFKTPSLNVYRNTFSPRAVDTFTMQDFEYRKRNEYFDFSNYLNLIKYLPYARRSVSKGKFVSIKDVLAICYQKDIQNFFKLLKINLFREGYKGYFSYTYASEYGETYLRCHFHTLISFDRGYESLLQRCIIKSWKNSDLSRLFKDEAGHYRAAIEVARNPATYVSTYINLRSIVPKVYLDSKCFAPKIKFSQGYGLHFKYFSKDEVLKMFYRTDLSYPCRQIINGTSTERMVQVPKYVLSKYFPKFKGFRYLSSDEIFDILIQPECVYEENFYKKMRLLDEDIPKIEKFLLNKRKDWCDLCKDVDFDLLDSQEQIIQLAQSISEYAFVGSRIWFLYASDCIKHSYDEVKCDMDIMEHFDNISDFLDKRISHGLLENSFVAGVDYSRDPSSFRRNVAEQFSLQDKFDHAIKCHRSHSMYENKFI